MGWELITDSVPGSNVGPFLGEEMLLMDPQRMNPIISLKLYLNPRCGTILPMKLTNMQKKGLHKDISKTHLYCVIDYIINNINVSSECITSVYFCLFRLHDYLESFPYVLIKFGIM